MRVGSDVADLAATAASSRSEFDLQVMECGAEPPLRVQGMTSHFFAYRGGFSPMEDKPGAVYREARYGSSEELRQGLRSDLAKGIRCRRAFLGLHTICHAYGFDIALDAEGRVQKVEPVRSCE